MLENPTPTAPDSAPVIKRYAPPNQRNRSLGRRKSGGYSSRNNPLGVGDVGSSAVLHERPIMYSGSSDSAWRNFRLPHQMMSPTNSSGASSGSQMDFLGELHGAIRNANSEN